MAQAKVKNALDPRQYETGDIDLSVWDGDPKAQEKFGSQTQEIKKRLQPFLKKVLGDGVHEFDVAFFTEKDMLINLGPWQRIPFSLLMSNKAWDQSFSTMYCLQDLEGALVWRGYVSGTPHFLMVQRMDYRKKERQQFYHERQRRLEMTAPEGQGADAVMREAETNIETKANVPLVSTTGDEAD